jgi:hypothetical protein
LATLSHFLNQHNCRKQSIQSPKINSTFCKWATGLPLATNQVIKYMWRSFFIIDNLINDFYILISPIRHRILNRNNDSATHMGDGATANFWKEILSGHWGYLIYTRYGLFEFWKNSIWGMRCGVVVAQSTMRLRRWYATGNYCATQ